MSRTAIDIPTAMPAFAPDERPEAGGVEVSEVSGGEVPVVLGALPVVEVVRVRIRVETVVGGLGVQLSTEKERKKAPIEVHWFSRMAVGSSEQFSSL